VNCLRQVRKKIGGGVVPSREPLRLCHRHKWNGLEQGLVFQIDDDLVRSFFLGGGGLLLWWSVSYVRMKMWNVVSPCKLLARKWQCGAFLNCLEISELALLYTQLLDSSTIGFVVSFECRKCNLSATPDNLLSICRKLLGC
jgi:hypothetical protein